MWVGRMDVFHLFFYLLTYLPLTLYPFLFSPCLCMMCVCVCACVRDGCIPCTVCLFICLSVYLYVLFWMYVRYRTVPYLPTFLYHRDRDHDRDRDRDPIKK